MYKIGEFSSLSQVSVRMLRHYDKLGLLTPSHTDAWTGYRYYTIDQLARLNRIVALNGLGLTLQQISDLLARDGELPAEQLRGMLMMRHAAIEQELAQAQMQLVGVEARLRQIELEGKPSPYEIVLKSLVPLPIASVRHIVPNVAEMGFYCELLYDRLYKRLAYLGVAPLDPEITLYHAEEYAETDLDVEAGTAIEADVLDEDLRDDLVTFRIAPGAEQVASLIYTGPLAELLPAVLALLNWVGLQNRLPAGPLQELHLSGRAHDEGSTPGDMVTELLVPVQSLRGNRGERLED